MLCPHCQKPAQLLFVAHDKNRNKSGSFDYYQGPCGLVFIGEIPADLSIHYQGGYNEIPSNEAGLAEMAKTESYRLDTIKKYVPKGAAYLEIGPWIGLAAYNAKLAGYQVSTLEFNEDCIDLMQRSGINAMQTDDPAAALAASDKYYDVIAMWHSIEHLPRPWDVIDQATKRLKKSGVFFIAAPNPESAQMQVYGKDWFHLDAPRHIYLPNASMIEEIAARNGLRQVERTTDDKLGRIIERDGWHHALHNHVPVPGLRRLYKIAATYFLNRKYRKAGDFGGAGYSLAFIKE